MLNNTGKSIVAVAMLHLLHTAKLFPLERSKASNVGALKRERIDRSDGTALLLDAVPVHCKQP